MVKLIDIFNKENQGVLGNELSVIDYVSWLENKIGLSGEEILDNIIELFSDEEILVADGYNDAIIGIDSTSMKLIYSIKKTIDIIAKDID